MSLALASAFGGSQPTAAPPSDILCVVPKWVRNGAWFVAIGVVGGLYFWAPWPSEWITTAILVALIVTLFVMERLA